MKPTSDTGATEDKDQLWQVFHALGGDHVVRTRHLEASGRPRHINRLIREDSPYLLQHAHNPVDWYPWGDDAFARATREDRPLFLSIGYSTCHWCHVMEEESFDNEDIAELLNRHFVCIKLDREQHPDIDDYYMTAVQFISGHGGWPMSNFLMPDGRPFYSATYFPPGQFAALIERVGQLWKDQRQSLAESAEKVRLSVEQWLQDASGAEEVDLIRAETQVQGLLEREDIQRGGLAGAPKFPQEPLLMYFLDRLAGNGELVCCGFVLRALEAMAAGGIHDQAGGGFHRYSVDADWLVPHFEKMLYNQAQLSRAYLMAWRLTGDPTFRRVITRTLDYVLRDMQLPEGGFYSATDADSEGEEGRFFVWSWDELQQLLDPGEFALLVEYFDISKEGNFEHRNILSLVRPLFDFPDQASAATVVTRVDAILEILRQHRQLRVPPLRDDKLIVSWSAAMAGSLVMAGYSLDRPEYIQAGRRAAEIMWRRNYHEQNGLQRISLHGRTSIRASLEDYAALCELMILLFDVDQDREFLNRAAQLCRQMLQRFRDPKTGLFYNSEPMAEGPHLVRSCNAADGAVHSAIGMALGCLVRLSQRVALTGFDALQLDQDIHKSFAAHGPRVMENPAAHVTALGAMWKFRHGATDAILYAGRGLVRIAMRRSMAASSTAYAMQMELYVSPGWSLATDATDGLTPLRLEQVADSGGWTAGIPEWPASIDGKLTGRHSLLIPCQPGNSDHPLAGSLGLILTVQVCGADRCLAPERLYFRI